jgi:hypothetical protein
MEAAAATGACGDWAIDLASGSGTTALAMQVLHTVLALLTLRRAVTG